MADSLLSSFNFRVSLTPVDAKGAQAIQAGFSEVSGLETQLERVELREGGYHLGMRQLIGKTSHPEIVLKRGVSTDEALWRWAQACISGVWPIPYMNGTIEVFDTQQGLPGTPGARFVFSMGLVTRIKGPDLQAISTQVPIEELSIAHEGLRREVLQ